MPFDTSISSSKPSPVTSSSALTETSIRVPSPTHPSTHTSMKPEEIDYRCCHRILSALMDNLYNIHYKHKSAKEQLDALEEEYDLDDTRIERFTSSLNKFTMVDSKPINE